MRHALSLSIIRGCGDVATCFILPLSAAAYAMQLCKQSLVSADRHRTPANPETVQNPCQGCRTVPPGKSRERLVRGRDITQSSGHPGMDMAEHGKCPLDRAQLRRTI